MNSSLRSLRLLTPLLLPLALPACLHPSTEVSQTRTEWPTLSKRDPELSAVEQLTPIGRPEKGVLRPVDMGWLETVLGRYAEAIAAVTRGNIRAGANRKIDRCVRAVFETGNPAADCLRETW